MSPEAYKPTQEEIKLAESYAEDYREIDEKLEVEKYEGILKRARTGELTPWDYNEIDTLLEGVANPPLAAFVAGESKREEARASAMGKIFIELFSDSKALAILKEFALQAYEDKAIQNNESSSFGKLMAFGNIAEQFGGDGEIKKRFSATQEGEVREEEVPLTAEDVEKWRELGITGYQAGDKVTRTSIPWPVWSYNKSE